MGAPARISRLAARRAAARAAGDYRAADAFREQIVEAGWQVTDAPEGWRLDPIVVVPAEQRSPHYVPSMLQAPARYDATVLWVCEGWPSDLDRAIDAFRAVAGEHEVQYVIADVTGELPGRWGPGVELLSLADGTGWAAALNAGLRCSLGRIVLVTDGSIEPGGDVIGPMEAALRDPQLGICGPFGLTTKDLRDFVERSEPGACDAVEGYLMAIRRETLLTAGLFDEHFRWYRSADIEYSFRVRNLGMRTEVVPVPVTRHEHRMWVNTDPEERAAWSKRNFYRFLSRWRDRWDLVLAGPPRSAP